MAGQDKTNTTDDVVDDRLDEAFDRLENPDQAGSGSPIAVVAMLLSLLAIGAASYSIYTSFMADTGTTVIAAPTIDPAQLQALNEQLAEQAAQIGSLQTTLTEMGSGDAEVDLGALQEDWLVRFADLEERMGGSRQDWVLAEAEYLIRMANQRVLMERDPVSALAMLMEADSIIARAEGLTAHSLREALATDIAALEAVAQIDQQGIYLKLAALARQVAALKEPTHNFVPVPVEAIATPADATLTSRVLGFLRKTGARIASLVDFRRDVPQVTPILPPTESYYLRQNLMMKIQMAQLALLDERQPVYSTSLADARVWVTDHFDSEDAATIAFIESLDVLMAVNVEMPLPNVSASLREARSLVGNRMLESRK